MKEKQELKECKIHGSVMFALESNSGRFRCTKCRSTAVQKRRDKLKQMAVDYKDGKCERCDYNKSLHALDFHHKDRTQKDFGISKSGITRSWEKVKQELDKCMLVCANCHREIHALEGHL